MKVRSNVLDRSAGRAAGRRGGATRLATRLIGRGALLFALAAGCGADADAPTAPRGVPYSDVASAQDAGPRVVFLGDSLTAGLHLPADQAWPAVLQRRLAARGIPFDLVNAGVSGDTTAGGLARLDWLLQQDPDWLVVALGGNDGLRGIPLEAIAANLRALCERALDGGTEVVLLGMRVPPNYGADYASGFAALFAELAHDLGLPYVPFYIEGVAGRAELLLPDGLHPTAAGHERIVDNLEPLFVALLDGD